MMLVSLVYPTNVPDPHAGTSAIAASPHITPSPSMRNRSVIHMNWPALQHVQPQTMHKGGLNHPVVADDHHRLPLILPCNAIKRRANTHPELSQAITTGVHLAKRLLIEGK